MSDEQAQGIYSSFNFDNFLPLLQIPMMAITAEDNVTSRDALLQRDSLERYREDSIFRFTAADICRRFEELFLRGETATFTHKAPYSRGCSTTNTKPETKEELQKELKKLRGELDQAKRMIVALLKGKK